MRDDYDKPEHAPLGKIFWWKGRMWRRGRGIIYVAHPNAGLISEHYRRRHRTKAKRAERRERYLQRRQT